MDQGGVHAHVLPQPGEILADRYVIESIIGCGAMSVVFGARHRVSGKRCAIKLLLPEQRAALPAVESRGAASVNGPGRLVGHFQHPHVLDVQDVGEVRGSFYTVMDWMDGESLAARLARVGSLSVVELRNLLVPCIRGMHAAHGRGIVHRDLSPSSIYICQGTARVPEIAKVLDFGVAEFEDGEAARHAALTRWTDAHEAASEYRAPEQRCGLPADHRADIYAFGAIVYRALSGQPPTAAFTDDVRLVFAGPPPLRSSAPGVSEAGDIARRAMSSELSERFQSLADLADALEFFRVAPRRLAAGETTPLPLPPRRSMPADLPHWSIPEVPRRSAPPVAAMDMPRPSEPRMSSARVSFPPPAVAPRAARSNKWIYVALAAAVCASLAALWFDERSSEETDVIASFEGVAGETTKQNPAQPAAPAAPPEPQPPEPPPPSAASPIAAPVAPQAPEAPPSAAAAAVAPARPSTLRLPLTPPPLPRREREPVTYPAAERSSHPRPAAQPTSAPKPAQPPPPAPAAQRSLSADELPMKLF